MKRGVVYHHAGPKKGEVDISAVVKELKKIAMRLRWVGAGLVVFGVLGLVFIYTPLVSVLVRYEIKSKVRNQKAKVVVMPTPMPVPLKPSWVVPDESYSIYIPKIEALSKVVKNVNTAVEREYQEALKLGVAHAAGLSVPGQQGTTYLFSHSVSNPINFARYNAVFYLLDKLVVGDDIEVVYEGKLLKYKVLETEITKPKDTKYLVPQMSEEKLVLQTCYPPGTTWQRLNVVAKRVY